MGVGIGVLGQQGREVRPAGRVPSRRLATSAFDCRVTSSGNARIWPHLALQPVRVHFRIRSREQDPGTGCRRWDDARGRPDASLDQSMQAAKNSKLNEFFTAKFQTQ